MWEKLQGIHLKSWINIGIFGVAVVILQIILVAEIGFANWLNTLYLGRGIFLLAFTLGAIAGWINGKYFRPSVWERLLFFAIYCGITYVCTKFLFETLGFMSRWLVYLLIVIIIGVSSAISMLIRRGKKYLNRD